MSNLDDILTDTPEIAKTQIKVLMLNLITDAAIEADKIERPVKASTLMRLYREKVSEL